MTTRRRKVTEDEPLARLPATPAATATVPLTATEERRERELEDLLEEIGTDGRIKVWHVIDGKSVYAGEISHDGFSLDVLIDVFGGGDKSLVFYQGRTKVETIRVALDPSIPAKNPRTPKGGPVAPGAAAPAGGIGEFVPLFTAMMTMNMQSMQQSQQMMTGMVTAMTSLMTARPEKDPTEMALKVVEILKPQAAPAGLGMTEMFGLFEKGMNIGAKMSGHDEDPTMSAVNKGLETLGVIVNGYVEDRKAQAAARTAEARRVTAGAAEGGRSDVVDSGTGVREADAPRDNSHGGSGHVDENVPTATAPQVRPWVDATRPFVGQLIAAASVLTPSQAADIIATRMDDAQFADLIEDILNQDNGGFGVRLAGYFPAMKTLDADWVGKVVQSLLTEHAEFEEDDAPPSPSAPSTPAVAPPGNGVTG